ncbi:helix-turn-helix transcriptional regulator [Sphingobacterium siyangense]|uniref:helix-turn-helix transcriptional regulator n=1 Tax=Sphingobacterium siyangense TaxID=459529 RepID=UPI003DA2BF43
MDKYKFCIWLVDSLLRKPLSFEELQNKWTSSSSNDSNKELSERSFIRYRREAELLFHVQIKYEKRIGKYSLVDSENIQQDKLLSWILATYRLSNVSLDIKQKAIIQLEPPAPKSEYLNIILEAIESKSMLHLTYKSHYKDPEELDFYPVFVRLCQQRWYVIGINLNKDLVRVYAFERISNLTIRSYDGKPISHTINPDEYFSYSYGVINDEEPQLIQIRAFWPQNLYLKDVPLHPSQEALYETEDFTDFELFVRPTYDFIQALLSQREQVIVLGPHHLVKNMQEVIAKMAANYLQ